MSEADPTLYEFVCRNIRFIARGDYFGFHSWCRLAVVDREEMRTCLRLAGALVHLAAHLHTNSEDENLPDEYENLFYQSLGFEVEHD